MKPNVFCFKAEVATMINRLNNEFAEFLENLVTVTAEVAVIRNNLQTCRMLMAHWHRSHQHPNPHDPTNIRGSKCGYRRDWMTPREVDALCPGFYYYWMPHEFLYEELLTKQDLDNNGFIYGIDFRISIDENTPVPIRKLETEVIYGYDYELTDNFISFADYIDTLDKVFQDKISVVDGVVDMVKNTGVLESVNSDTSSNDVVDWEPTNNSASVAATYASSKKSAAKRASQQESCDFYCARLIGEWYENEDLDNNGLIYGVDFYLPDTEGRKTQSMKKIEKTVKWVSSEYSNRQIMSFNEYVSTLPDDDELVRRLNNV